VRLALAVLLAVVSCDGGDELYPIDEPTAQCPATLTSSTTEEVGGVLVLVAESWPQGTPPRSFTRLRVDGEEMVDYLEPGEEALGVRVQAIRWPGRGVLVDWCRVDL
jgi:hypothetical protein